MPATLEFLLLSFALRISLCKNFPEPYFDAGENLSSPNCGIWKINTKSTWEANLRLDDKLCSGIVVSQRDILTYQCRFQENEKENIRVYVGECASSVTYHTKKCLNAYIEVKNVTMLTLNSGNGGEVAIKLFVTKKKLPNTIIPICLFNRASDKKSIYYAWRRLHGVNERKKAFLREELAVRKIAPIEKCFSNQSSEMNERLAHFNTTYLCVHANESFYDIALVAFYKNRFFLRGLSVWSHLPDLDDYFLHLDVAPFTHAIGEQAKEIYVHPPIPPRKPMKKFGDLENLSFPGCGTKGGFAIEKATHDALVSGRDAPQHEHPWHAHISIFGEFNCGGTLISRRTVLTAAHCIVLNKPEELEVTIGMYDKNLEQDFLATQKNIPTSLITHPDYEINQMHHDVGLMIFDQGFNITDHVRPICLWNGGSSLDHVAGKFATAIGFGYFVNNETYSLPGKLQEARMPIISHKECYLSNRRFFRRNLRPGDNFCAGYTNGTTTCNGDSGGSLSLEKNNRWFLRGVVSFGKSRNVTNEYGENITVCRLDSFSLFVDVASYTDWIVENAPDVSFKSPEEFVAERAPPDASRNLHQLLYFYNLTLVCILAFALYCCMCIRSHWQPELTFFRGNENK